jgi:hypothetical protein
VILSGAGPVKVKSIVAWDGLRRAARLATPKLVGKSRSVMPSPFHQEWGTARKSSSVLPFSRSSIRRIAVANSAPIQVWGMSPMYSGDRGSLQTTSAQCR